MPVDCLVAGPFVENHRVIIQVLPEIERQCIIVSLGVEMMDEQSHDSMPTVKMPAVDLNARDRPSTFDSCACVHFLPHCSSNSAGSLDWRECRVGTEGEPWRSSCPSREDAECRLRSPSAVDGFEC